MNNAKYNIILVNNNNKTIIIEHTSEYAYRNTFYFSNNVYSVPI